MPSFFARRYMRGQPRRTERLVGVLVLGVLALIVGLFALTGGLFANVVHRVPFLSKAKDAVGISEKPLFVPEPKNVKPPAPPHADREALGLFPDLTDIGGLTRFVSVERVNGKSTVIDNQMVDFPEMEDFEAENVYAVSYQSRTVPVIRAAILDMGQPEAAFGIWRSRRPSVAKRLPLGREGWVADASRQIGFWSGRHYTELSGSSSDAASDIEILRKVAVRLAGVQLNYGGPFWSESVLPREGQVERSFRYLKKNALAVPELSNCWLADYQNGLTIGVMQPASPEKLLTGLKQRAASQPADAHAMESEALAASTITWSAGDRTLTGFDAGPYVFVIAAPPQQSELVATTSKMLHDRWSGPDAIAQAAVSSGLIGPQAAGRKSQAAPAAGLARFAEVGDDIIAPTKIERYTDNLYEKIDGREGQFRAFNFVELRFGQYLDDRNKQSFDVYLYDMAEPNNALGIFMKERSSAETSAGVGRDSYVSGTNVYFWKGKYYVNVLGPSDGGDGALANAKKIAAGIAETIADTGGGFWAEDVLPKEDRLPESFKYIATSALSYDFLNRVYRADYKTNDKTYGLFALKASSPERARELYIQLADAAKKYGDVIEQRVDTPGSELVVTRSIDVFMVAFCKGVFVGGVADCDDKDLAIAKAQFLRERMPADAPGEPEPAAPEGQTAPSEGEPRPEGDANEGDSDGY